MEQHLPEFQSGYDAFGSVRLNSRVLPQSLGSLRNQDATPRTMSIKKVILYFTYESRDTLKSFSFVSQCPNYNETESGTRRNI